ncbi:tyrosine-type recombinase/integrase [Shimazuella sp. AN120528]|uniref:tyrosine-type recombinase/integrase n=1 Tax=Shimazuella soli TaxID=1892854 RepID=UPI001F0FAC0A|nr:tyrosine-type recombinase/integrase [Shimazuella soli]MCH5586492.1 tyrosine-type recombinase/integrase [Shimazuella soli]
MKAPLDQRCLDLLEEYEQYLLSSKSDQTVDAYLRILRQFIEWIGKCPSDNGIFLMEHLSREDLEVFLAKLQEKGYSSAHQHKVRAAISRFANWLIQEKQLLSQNPAHDVYVPPQAAFTPRELTDEQREVLRGLVERQQNMRGNAIFALGYWAGCRVCDVSWLQVEDCHVGPKTGWITVGAKSGKKRDIDLLEEVRKPLYEYLNSEERKKKDSSFVFLSQKSGHLTENGIHRWFASLKKKAAQEEWELIHDITFHELRQDFAYRARSAGWSLEEIAYYLGHVTKQGTPSIQATAKYTQLNREQIKEKLKQIEEKNKN